MSDVIQFASGLSVDHGVAEAVPSLADQVRNRWTGDLEDQPLDLVLFFFSAHYTQDARQIAEGLLEALGPRLLLGCSAEGVIGSEREVEDRAAIALAAARLPGVKLSSFTLHPPDWPRLLLDAEEFRRVVAAPEDTRLIILLGDPFSTPTDDLLQAFNLNYPGVPIVGGMASGALRQFGNALVLNDQITNLGAVGVTLSGSFDVDVIVSQGCRPIWRPLTVTSAHKNMLFSLEGKPPLTLIQELIPELSEDERLLMQNGLFIGRAVRGTPETLGRGDFLIRGVIGMDRGNGAIAIADSVMEGELIQFHLRDALTAQEDLEMMLIPQMFCEPPSGALLFSCNGRGTRLYDRPNGDISIIQKNLGVAHLAGFFCAGELGPIGGANYLHGHTASMAIFRPAPPDEPV